MTTLPEPEDHAADIAAFESWRDAAYEAWDRIAPTYVQTDMQPLVGHLRQMYELRAPVERFAEALELAFANQSVTKRKALFYAYGILRNQFEEAE